MCQSCHWEAVIRDVDEAIRSGQFSWSESLPNIRETIERNGCAAEGQVAAIANILGSREWCMRNTAEAKGQGRLF